MSERKPARATKTNQGQQKTHVVTSPDGSTSLMTQAEWKDRDKSLGLKRLEDVETPEVVEPTPEEPANPA